MWDQFLSSQKPSACVCDGHFTWTSHGIRSWNRKHLGDLEGDLLILSQVDFEAAAQSVITETLREVQRLRPKALWGVSPYPSCYNGDPAQTTLANYSGQCPAAEMALNDELLWLWKRCSALYPLLTLEKLQVGNATLLFFVYVSLLHLHV